MIGKSPTPETLNLWLPPRARALVQEAQAEHERSGRGVGDQDT